MRWPWHRHKWRMLRVQQGTSVAFLGMGGGASVTLLLFRCDACGSTQTESINGLWTMEDFT
jgi:hypothetical protein